jgi:ribosome maturation factor RimP
VSSAGLERKLVRPEHFEWAKGKTVSVSLYKGGTVVGTLLEKNDAEIVLLCGEEEKKIPLSESGGTKLYFE